MVSRSTDKRCLTNLWSIAPKGNFSLDCHREDGSQAETECSMSQEANKNLVAPDYDEMWNKWNFALVEELLAKEISFRGSLGTESMGARRFAIICGECKACFRIFATRSTR